MLLQRYMKDTSKKIKGKLSRYARDFGNASAFKKIHREISEVFLYLNQGKLKDKLKATKVARTDLYWRT